MAELAIEHNYSTVSKQLTISMGVYSLIPCKKTTAQSLISGADKALYDAKNTGRNQVALYK